MSCELHTCVDNNVVICNEEWRMENGWKMES